MTAPLLGLLRRQALPAVIVLTVGVVAEILLQRCAPQYADRIYSDTLTGGHPLAINADGYRGEALTRDKPPGTVRLLVLGDSVSFGTGVAAMDAWPARVDDRLAATLHVPCQALNTALPATDVAQMSLALEERWLAYEPDAVAVLLTGNVVSLAWFRRDRAPRMPSSPWGVSTNVDVPEPGPAERVSRIVQSLALPGAAMVLVERLTYLTGLNDHRIGMVEPKGVMLAHGWRQGGMPEEMSERAWELVIDDLHDLVAAARRAGLPIVVGYSPPRFFVGDSWTDNLKRVPRHRFTIDPVERVRAACAELDVPFVDLAARLRTVEDLGAHYLLADYTHFSPRGHRLVADAYAERLAPLLETQ